MRTNWMPLENDSNFVTFAYTSGNQSHGNIDTASWKVLAKRTCLHVKQLRNPLLITSLSDKLVRIAQNALRVFIDYGFQSVQKEGDTRSWRSSATVSDHSHTNMHPLPSVAGFKSLLNISSITHLYCTKRKLLFWVNIDTYSHNFTPTCTIIRRLQ